MNTSRQPPAILDDLLYDSQAAGAYLGNFKEPTMRNSRTTGVLGGVQAPPHRKIGSKVLYEGRALKDWRSQFIERITANDPSQALNSRADSV